MKSGRDVEFGTIYSKLFTETGELKYFVSVAGLAKRTGVWSPNAVRRYGSRREMIEAVCRDMAATTSTPARSRAC